MKDDFSVMLAYFDELDGRRIIPNPQQARIENVNYYIFYLSGFVVYIKVDKRQTRGCQRKFLLSQGSELAIVSRPFNSSHERMLLSRLIKTIKR